MIDKSIMLQHYKRRDVQEAMIANSSDREVSIRYANGGFGKRPDVLQYPADVIEMVKAGAVSFHVSEERWSNPMMLSTELKKKELEAMRTGWDLVIDIDCPVFEYSKIIAYLIIKALRRYGINAISCKFSGNKGFHIAVPFESFPSKVSIKGELRDIRLLFPDGLRRILDFLGNQIDSKERGYELSSMILKKDSLETVAGKMQKSEEEMFKTVCKKCESEHKKEYRNFEVKIICPYCEVENNVPPDSKVNYITCLGCGKIIRNEQDTEEDVCQKCKGKEFFRKFDSSHILELDSVLISSRHLYRMVYSLHEKSGLASVPVHIDKVLDFEREDADPSKIGHIETDYPMFLDRKQCRSNEAKKLTQEAFDDDPLIEAEEVTVEKEYEVPKDAVPQDMFPPCMKKILNGGATDGKKRMLFSLLNFLDSVGWNHAGVENAVSEWNARNEDPLREAYVRGQMDAHKQKKKHMLPHNCRSYYEELHVCFPDALCNKIKNPVNYSLAKLYIQNKESDDKKKRSATEENPNLTDKQREFIKKRKEREAKFREKRKAETESEPAASK